MLPFKNRLTKKRDIIKTQKYGRFYQIGNIMIKALKNDQRSVRISFVAAAKFLPSAGERNQVKRRLRELFREKLESMKKGQDVVVAAVKQKGEKIKKEKLKEDVENVLRKADLLAK
jgi:ribonuclease P protein component